MTADLVVRSDRPIVEQIAATRGIRAVSEEVPLVMEVPEVATDSAGRYEPTEALAVDPAGYPRIHRADQVDGAWADLHGDAMAVSPAFADRFGVGPGDVQRVRIGGSPRDLRVAAVLPRTLTGPDIALPLTMAGQVDAEHLYFLETDALDRAGLQAKLRAVTGASAHVSVSTAGEWIQSSSDSQREQSHNVILAILSLVTAYIAIAVVNAVVIAGADRRREFAIARLTGLDRALVVRTALWESMVVVLIGSVLGLVAAATTLVGVAAAVSSVVGHTVVAVPWALLGLTVSAATLLVAAAGLLTALAGTRSPAIEVARARE
jgi:putative ABC transport system permease protein